MIQISPSSEASAASGSEELVRAVPALDRLAALAAKLLRTPLAFVSLVETARQKFPGMSGTLPEPFHQRQTPISHSFCQHVAATGEPLVIQDAHLDERVARNPAVRELNFVAYAGMPLTTADGQTVGSLCAVDAVPRAWTGDEQNTLRELAGFALTELEAHRNEQRLREAEQALAAKTDSERARLIESFRHSPSFVAVLRGRQYVYEFVNDRYSQLVGRSVDDILQRSIREVLPELEAQGVFDLFDQVYATGKPYTGKNSRVLFQHEPGQPPTEHFIDFAFQPTRAADGSVDGIFVQGVDWTARKLAQKETILVSEQRRLALDSAQLGWYHYDVVTGMVALDERARTLYGVEEEQVTYERFLTTIHPDDVPVRETAFQAAMIPSSPGLSYQAEYRVKQADGSWRWLQVKGKPSFSGEGEARRAQSMDCTVADVTEAKTAQEALVESERKFRQMAESERVARAEAERVSQMKDEFLATLSHELRTPLNAILGWTQVLRDDSSHNEDTANGLATIERNARAQTQIIEDLLDMSRIISGKVRLDVQPLHLDQVVSAAVDTMRPAAAAKNIRLQTLIDPQARMISGDPNRLQQVFWNLLSNAIKFTPKDGKVQVVLERINSHLEVNVADTGEGIAPEFLPYVFDRFRQQDASTTRRHGGLGLGLAIVKQLVELHGGSIRAESAGPGRGTTFRVVLPLSVVQPAPEPTDPERRHPQSGGTTLPVPAELLDLTGVKVLVVDDEPDAQALVKRLLDDRRATVQTASSAAEALAALQAIRPDVLISDIGMPEEDGYSLLRRVRALKAEEGGQVPAIALTAYARTEDRLKAVLAGFQVHVSKPVNAVELLALVANLAGRIGR